MSNAPQSPPKARALTWDGCFNVRDLGGHATEDGRETRYGRVVRSDSVHRLSDDGWRALEDYGVRTVLDLRYQVELDEDPPRDVEIEILHVSLLGEPEHERWVEVEARALETGTAVGFTRTVYLDTLERYRANLAAAVNAVGDAAPGGVVVHCHAGKDRTGLVSALLLRLAGVPIADAAHDYAVSERNLAERSDLWIAEAETEAERDLRRRVSATPADGMATVLEELERRYGDVPGYLRAGGASDADLDPARARLLDD